MNRTGARNNILAGTFIVVTIVAAVWVSFMLSDRSGFGSVKTFMVRFSLEDGAAGLKHGSAVNLGGQPVGRVIGVTFDRAAVTPGQDVPTGVLVKIEVRSDLVLYENASIYITLPLLGTLSAINITWPGSSEGVASPQGASAAVESGEVIAGRMAPPQFLAGTGFGSDQAEQLRSSFAALESGMNKAKALIEANAPVFESSLEDVRAMLASLRERSAAWERQIDAMVANAAKASERLDPLLASAQSGVDDARAMIGEARAVIGDNRARIDSIVASIESAASKVDSAALPTLLETLGSARDSLASFEGAVTRLGSLLASETPSLRRTLANLRLMSDQLKLTAVEVRSQPWRLLHQPNTKEVEAQVVYDAARSYAQAASDLRAASESLEAATADPSRLRDEAVADVTTRLGQAFERFRLAEKYLLDKLIEKEQR